MRMWMQGKWLEFELGSKIVQARKKENRKNVRKKKARKIAKKKERKENTPNVTKKHRGNKKKCSKERKKQTKNTSESWEYFLRANRDHECIMSAFGSRNFGLMQLEKVKVENVLCNFSRAAMKAALFSVMNGLQIKE